MKSFKNSYDGHLTFSRITLHRLQYSRNTVQYFRFMNATVKNSRTGNANSKLIFRPLQRDTARFSGLDRGLKLLRYIFIYSHISFLYTVEASSGKNFQMTS